MKIHCSYDDLKDIELLVPHPSNPNKHPEKQIKYLAKIMKHQGWRHPITVSNRSGFIVTGHGRLEAAKKNGWNQVPIDKQDFASEADEYAHLVADNKIAELAEHDDLIMRDALKDLPEFDYDLLGIPDFELIEEKVLDPGGDEDDVPGEVEDPGTVDGDIWKLGRHRLMCGDATNLDQLSELMNGTIADLVFTDPPYGVSYQSNRTKSDKFDVLENDNLILDVIPAIMDYSKGWVFVWTSWKVQNKWVDLMSPLNYPSNMVIWHKPGGGIGDLKKTFSSDYEVGLVWHRGAELCGKRVGSVWTVGKDGATTYKHPTQKPVALAEEAIDKTTNNGDSVLDLFGGSGSTLIACEKTNRTCYMMELEPKYVRVIIDRWEKYTGEKAELTNGT